MRTRLSIFADFSEPSEESFELLRQLKPDCVVLGLNSQDDPSGKLRWRGLYPKSAPERVVDMDRRIQAELGAETAFLLWVRPDTGYNRRVFAVAEQLLDYGATPRRLILDAERCYVLPQGQASPDAYETVGGLLADLWDEFRLPWGVTSFGYVPPRVLGLARRGKFYIPQLYSAINPKVPETLTPGYAPGVLQANGMRLCAERLPDVKIAPALPLFGLKRAAQHPGGRMSAAASLEAQLDGLPEGGFDEVLYWSLKALLALEPKTRAAVLAVMHEARK